MPLALTERYRYTYNDYLHTPDNGKRWEIIDGVPYMMSVPNIRHQSISGKMFYRLYGFLEGTRCSVFYAPFDVRIPLHDEKDEDVINVVQPDLTVYCNDLGTDEKGGIAAPDIVIEILSPSTAKMDRLRKFKLYEQAGVKEYWIVDGASGFVEVYIHDGNKFLRNAYCDEGDIIKSTVLEGFEITIDDIFKE